MAKLTVLVICIFFVGTCSGQGRSVADFFESIRTALMDFARGDNSERTSNTSPLRADNAMPRFTYRTETVEFRSNGLKVVGRLFTPEDGQQQHPAVTFLGPFCFVKEMAPVQYATRLASLGYVTLIFDPRHHGESEGEPRRFENAARKVEDVKASIDYLQSLPQVNRNAILAVGICQGSSEMFQVAVQEGQRIKALATVAGNYIDRGNMEEFFGSGREHDSRIARGLAAKRKYEQTGQVDYLPIVDPERKDVGLPWRQIWEWYHGWVPRSRWENRYAVMSDAEIWTQPAYQAAQNITQPYLMVHANNCDGPTAARRFFAAVRSEKQLQWEGDTVHFQFYDDPIIIDKAVEGIHRHFTKYIPMYGRSGGR